MKKTKIAVSAMLIVSMILSVLSLSFSVYAEESEWDSTEYSEYDDVVSDNYFFDAVNWASDNFITDGVGEATFGPDLKITRAQAVVLLYRFSGSPEVTESSPFTDVPDGTWYTNGVIWAYNNGITDGVSATEFNPGGYCTRAQIVTFIYRYAMSSTEGLEGSFVDVPEDSYYFNPVNWCVANGITDGMDATHFAPESVCNRAQMVTFLYRLFNGREEVTPIYCLLINDVPVDETWVIAYEENGEGGGVMVNAANELQEYIERATGIRLSVIKAEELGDENRFYIKNEVIEGKKDGYTYKNDEKGIEIAGSYQRGALYGVYNFLEDELGWHFLSFDTEGCDAAGVLNLKGLDVKYLPYFSHRDLYVTEMVDVDICVKRMINGTERRYIPVEWGGQEPFARGHTMAGLAEQQDENSNPCYYDENVYNTILKNVKNALASNPNGYIAICQNDTQRRCTCDKCREMEAYYESGAGPLIEMLNKISDATIGDYPNSHIVTYAYQYTRTCPKNITCRDNIIIEFAPIDACKNHSYGDPDCPVNAALKEDIEGWGKIAKAVSVYDYGVSFLEYLNPMPNFDTIYENAKFLNENNAIGFMSLCLGRFTSGIPTGTCSPEFGALRSYLYSITLENPYMSWEEYQHEIDVFCRYNYGRGWRYVRKFIDFIHELSDEVNGHFTVGSFVEGVYGQHPFSPYNDQLVEWFDKAEKLAQSELQFAHVQRTRICCDYVRLGSIFRDYYRGTAEQKAYILAENEKLFKKLYTYDIWEIRDGVERPAQVNYKQNVRKWITINPYREENSPTDPT